MFRTPPTPRAQKLLRAARVKWRSLDEATDHAVIVAVAYRAARRDADVISRVLHVAEELLDDELNEEFVGSLLESVQHLASHGLPEFHTEVELTPLLGPRSIERWRAIDGFWTAVAAWRAESGPLRELPSVTDDGLRAIILTGHRSLPGGTCVSTADAVRYQGA